MNREFPPKHPVLGTPISVTTFDEVQDKLRLPRSDQATVIAVCNVHSVMTARRNPQLAIALGEADVATPDGMPLVWGLRALGHQQYERVYGPELMRRALADRESTLKHFLFGSTPGTLERLEAAARRLNPHIRIVGALAPPFRSLSDAEEAEVLNAIRQSRADVIWVGLGMPKQEHWVNHVKEQLPGTTLIGVGAAFDFIAGTKKQAPEWMQRSGLEWLYRLQLEPRRLWSRYLWNNPAFLFLLTLQVLRKRWLNTE